jgi:CRP-like cAMP-binding protein
MEAGATVVPAHMSCGEALRLLRDRGASCLIVFPVDGGPAVVEAPDLQRAVSDLPPGQETPRVTAVMRLPSIRVGPDDTIDVAQRVMHDSACRHLPVMEADDVVGTVSEEAVGREMDLLRGHRIFRGLDQDAIALLLRIARQRELSAGEVLLEEGKTDANLIVLDEGLLSVHTRQAGLIARVRPGELVGELEISGGANAATVRASEDSRVLVIERRALIDLLSQHPRLGSIVYSNISQILGEKLRRANRFVFLRGIARHRMLVVKVLAGMGLVFVLFTVGFGVASESPKFCTSCHYMQPYYDSWAASAHRDVRCIKCHYAYGFQGVLRGKVTGLAMVTRYATRTYDPKPEAEVADASCLRSGCHTTALRTRTMQSAVGIRYTHQAHADSTSIGARLRCTSCHQHGRQSAHFTVSKEVCFLCHLAGKSRDQAAEECRRCHEFDKAGRTMQQIDHATLPESMTCLSCHEAVLAGRGEVEEFRCYSCHLEPEKLSSDRLHQIHIQDREVDCFECHASVEHKGGTGPILAHNCESCHPDQHQPQEQVYLGYGGRDVTQTPGIMAFFHVECTGCHGPDSTSAAKSMPPSPPHQRRDTTEEQCAACHDLDMSDKLRMWRTTIDTALMETQRALGEVEAALSRVPEDGDPVREQAARLYQDAAYNLALVQADNSRGVHNFKFTRDLLTSTQQKLKRALDLLGS